MNDDERVLEMFREQFGRDWDEDQDGAGCLDPFYDEIAPVHEHVYGPVEMSRFAGVPHRRCSCGMVSLDLDDDE